MSKNKAQQAKRRAAKALKRKRKKKSAVTRAPLRKSYLGTLFNQAMLPYWYVHGANYFASSYSDGTWNPIYDGIYEGLTAGTQEQLLAKVSTRYDLQSNPDNAGTPIVAWCVMPPEAVIGTYHALIGNLVKEGMTQNEAEKIAIQPHHSAVWAFFDEFEKQIVENTKK